MEVAVVVMFATRDYLQLLDHHPFPFNVPLQVFVRGCIGLHKVVFGGMSARVPGMGQQDIASLQILNFHDGIGRDLLFLRPAVAVIKADAGTVDTDGTGYRDDPPAPPFQAVHVVEQGDAAGREGFPQSRVLPVLRVVVVASHEVELHVEWSDHFLKLDQIPGLVGVVVPEADHHGLRGQFLEAALEPVDVLMVVPHQMEMLVVWYIMHDVRKS